MLKLITLLKKLFVIAFTQQFLKEDFENRRKFSRMEKTTKVMKTFLPNFFRNENNASEENSTELNIAFINKNDDCCKDCPCPDSELFKDHR